MDRKEIIPRAVYEAFYYVRNKLFYLFRVKAWDKELARKIKEEPEFLDKPFFGIQSKKEENG